jgi:hypothetical protein
MTNLRLNRDTKSFASFRDEIVKRDRKFRVKKIDKNKISAFRDSSMFKKLSRSCLNLNLNVNRNLNLSRNLNDLWSIRLLSSRSFSLQSTTRRCWKCFFNCCHFRLMRILLRSFRLRLSSLLLWSRLRFFKWSKSLTIWTWTTSLTIRTWTTSTLC